ncbi:MAG: hypothetical protein VKP62_02100 [Candidatus Sericytochromatia bacterium]|nr:hypothetical protein [Candidatus Sericytochromatia bacterium]
MTPDAIPPQSPVASELPLLNPFQAAAMLDKSRATMARLAPRVGLLVEACRRRGVSFPQTPAKPPVLSPKGEMVVAYVVQTLTEASALGGLVTRVCGQWAQTQQAFDALAQALTHGRPAAPEIEEARRGVTFLSRLPTFFQADPVLSEVFPLPPTQELRPSPPVSRPLAPAATRHPVEGAAAESSVSAPDLALIQTAQRTLAHMAPRLEIIRLIGLMLDPTRSLAIKTIQNEEANTARKLAQRLRRYPRTVGQLSEAETTCQRLKRALELHQGEREIETTLQALQTLVQGFHRTLELADLFPPEQLPQFA